MCCSRKRVRAEGFRLNEPQGAHALGTGLGLKAGAWEDTVGVSRKVCVVVVMVGCAECQNEWGRV